MFCIKYLFLKTGETLYLNMFCFQFIKKFSQPNIKSEERKKKACICQNQCLKWDTSECLDVYLKPTQSSTLIPTLQCTTTMYFEVFVKLKGYLGIRLNG